MTEYAFRLWLVAAMGWAMADLWAALGVVGFFAVR